MFNKHSDAGYFQAMEGIRRKTLVFGEKTLLSEFRMEKGDAADGNGPQRIIDPLWQDR